MKIDISYTALRPLVALGILSGSALLATATDIVWTNLAGGNWNTAANWSPNTVPTAADHVAIITNAGTYSVTNNGSRVIAGLVLGGASGTQTLAQNLSYTLTLRGTVGSIGANGRFNLVDGAFTGTNVVTLDGQLNWSSGNLGGSGSATNMVLLITTNGRLNLATTASKWFYCAITNAGKIVWADTGPFNQYGTLHNLAGGLIDAQTNAIMNAAGASLFINEGTFRKSGGTGNTDLEPLLVNTGTLDAQVGTLRFLSQAKTFNPGTRFTGTGTNLLSAGTVTLEGMVNAENLVLGGATVAGNATLDGAVTWSSGTLASGASLSLLPGSLLRMISSNTKTLRGALTNGGQVIWQDAGQIDFYGLIHNTATGVFEARNDTYLDWIGGTPLFINDGVFRKTSATGITYVQVPLINNGTVDAQTGTIQLYQEAKTFNHGCQFTGAGAVILPSGTITLNGSLVSANLVLAGATLAGQGILSGFLAWTGGSIAAGASLTVASNGWVEMSSANLKVISGALTNAGQVVWSGTSDINLYGVIHNAAGGVFEVRNDANIDWLSGTPAFINDGTFRKAQSTGITYIQVAFINNGTVDVQTGSIQLLQQPKTFNAGCRFTGAGQSLLINGTVTLNGTIESENLVLAGATLAGAGSINGSFTWNSGTLSPNVSFNVTPASHLILASSSPKVINGSITNAGVVTWTGTGNLQVRGAIHNLPAGLFQIQNDEYLDWGSGTPVFINEGIVRKTVATGSSYCQIAFVNYGTVDVQTGTFQLYQEPKTFNAGGRFTGAGKTTLTTGTMTLGGEIYSENLVLSGASLTGAGGVNGSFTWNSGTLTPDVSFNITTNGLLLLASSGDKNLNGTVTNAGTVRWTGTGNLVVRGAIHNKPGGLFDAQNNEVLDFVSGTPVIVNEGTFRKSAGTNTTWCQIPFHNFGRVEANTGTLSFYNAGEFTDHAGTIALGGGIFQTAQPLALAGGQLTGAGTVRPGTGLTSAATVAPATNGVLRIEGKFTQLLPGTLNFALGGTVPGTNHSQLRITGDASLAGTIGVTLAEGYQPSPGDAFNVMTFKSRAGDFACFNGFLFLGQNRRLLTQYSATNLSLVTVSLSDPTNAVPRVTAQYPSALVCWPAEFTGWQLYATTNLATPHWLPLPGASNRWFEPVMVPEHYFRLGQP
jgi:fibronectin-binding autotransporter adhesin